MCVREARLEDASEIARVHIQSWRAAYRGLIPDSILEDLDLQERTQLWRKNLSRPNLWIFVAVQQESVVGFCSLAPARNEEEDPKAEMDTLGSPLMNLDASGWYAQAGAMLKPEAWEVAVRYSTVDPDRDKGGDEKKEAMLGVNRFFRKAGHALKLTADIARLVEKTGAGTDFEDIRVRVQLQIIY